MVEDNLPDALLVREAIRKENLPLDIHLVSDGERAIEFIAQAEGDASAPCPHILLIDLNLPKVEGFEVLRRLRASGKCGNIPVVVITSSDSSADRKESARLGAGYFRKPPNFDEFMKIGPLLRQLLKATGML